MSNVVFVTGGAGYIGSHACKRLRSSGYLPITLDNLSTGWSDSVKYGPFEHVDLTDREPLFSIFDKYKPMAVFHFAALSQVGESVNFPSLYWHNNFVGSLNLLEAAIASNCKKFVFSSTCATYGDQDNVLLTEQTPQFPENAYGASKKAVEDLLWQNAALGTINFVIFRYFNVAGADASAEIGEYHRPETHLIPVLLDVVSTDKKMFTIFGTDYDTPDGTCIRDYVHVTDLVDAHILGLKWLLNNNENRVFNLGSGHGHSVREVIENVHLVTGRNINITEGERRPGDCTRLVSASFAAKNELEWRPKRSSINQMISDAWKWHQVGQYLT